MSLTGVCLYYDKQNGNGRIYSKETAEQMVEDFKKKESTSLGVFYTDSDYQDDKIDPLGPELNRVSHKVTDVWIDEETRSVMGNIEILNETKSGKSLSTMIEATSIENFSIVSRGTGTVNSDGLIENYELHGFDIIPKEQSAFKGPIKISDL